MGLVPNEKQLEPIEETPTAQRSGTVQKTHPLYPNFQITEEQRPYINRAYYSRSVSLTPQNKAQNMLTERSLVKYLDAKSNTSSPINDQRRYAANPAVINQDIELQNQ